MRAVVAIVLVAGAATTVRAQEHQECPMSQPGARRTEVDHRHQHATDIPSDGTEHHFDLARNGGSIRLAVKDGSQVQARDRVRAHLQAIARSFAAGDFTMPMQIHDQVPPGVEVMKARKATIRYAYSESPNGGVVTIATADPEALVAVHEFLRFQIRDHGTGDPAK